ncbi:TPA: hypothetical protein P5P23_003852 [Clostridioides difficile]|nr:hypothetical protein [Clostridioides difficile]
MIDENLSCKEIKIFAMSKDEPRFKNKTYSYAQRKLFLEDLENVFKRDFTTTSINEKWVGDIIYIFILSKMFGAI